MSGSTYPGQSTYLITYQSETDPVALAFAARSRYRRPPDLDGLRYLELGCGHGIGLAAHAACHPGATFHGIDLMPDHVASLRALARSAGLTNLTAEMGDITALADTDPPGGRYDMIVMHGLWSWVGTAVRAALLRLLDRWAAPGALVYVSYNAKPFWAFVEPLRYVLREAMGPDPEDADAKRARGAVDDWLEIGGTEMIRSFWERMSDLPDRYLIHEFAATEADAFWPQDMDRAFAGAGLSPLGQVPLYLNHDNLSFDDTQRAIVALGREKGFPDTAADLAQGRSHRTQVYARGAPVVRGGTMVREMADWRIAPARQSIENDDAPEIPGFAEALAQVPTGITVPEAVEALSGPGRDGLQGLLLAVILGHWAVVPPEAEQAEKMRSAFNAAAAALAAEGDTLPCLICHRQNRPVRLSRDEVRHVVLGTDLPKDQRERLGIFDFRIAPAK